MKRWPINKAHFWEQAPFFRILLPFALGILCYDLFPVTASAAMICLAVLMISFCLFTAIFYAKKQTDLLRTITFLSVHILVFIGGISLSYYNDVRNNPVWFGNSIQPAKTYLVRITEDPAEKEHSWKLPVTVLADIHNGKVTTASGDAFIYLSKGSQPMLFHKGDSILVPAKWELIKNAGNPFEFDYARYCRRNNILYQQYCTANDVRLYSTNDPDAASAISNTHDWCMAQLDKYLPDHTTKGLIQAMLLGDEVNLDEDLRQSYSETGIIHIIAISGGNVAIFFLVISYLLWWLKNKKHLWIKYAIALPLVWFYVLMAGAPPSAMRAAIMFSLLAFAVILQKNNNSLNQLFATGFLLLCAEPMWLFSVGFQLSFVAVLSLILFYKPVYRLLSPANKILSLIWGTVAASIAAEILVAPLVIYFFHTFPLLFIIANVAAYLFMSIVLILGIAIIALSFVPSVATFVGIVTVWLVNIFDKIVTWLQAFNPASFHFLLLTGLELTVVYIAIAGISRFLLRKEKAGIFISLGALCILFCSLCHSEWIRLQQQRFVVYNAGKANHIELMQGRTYTILNTDTSTSKKTDYAIKPAHINWRAWQTDSSAINEIFTIGGKTVLILNRSIDTKDHFPVDYLVVNYTGKVDPVRLQQAFSPSLVIMGNNYSRKQQAGYVASFADAHVALHTIATDGAFVKE